MLKQLMRQKITADYLGLSEELNRVKHRVLCNNK